MVLKLSQVLICLLAVWIGFASAAPLPEDHISVSLLDANSADPDNKDLYQLYEPLSKRSIHQIENAYDQMSRIIFTASNRTEFYENLRKEYRGVMDLILTVWPGSPDYDFCRLMLSNYISLSHHEYASEWKQQQEKPYLIKLQKEIYGFMEEHGIPVWNQKTDFWAGTTPSPYNWHFDEEPESTTTTTMPTTTMPTTTPRPVPFQLNQILPAKQAKWVKHIFDEMVAAFLFY